MIGDSFGIVQLLLAIAVLVALGVVGMGSLLKLVEMAFDKRKENERNER